MMDAAAINPDVCILKHELVDSKLSALECEINNVKATQEGIRDEIREVRDLQKQILYAIIGVAVASILTLIGVIFGRAIDFGVFFP